MRRRRYQVFVSSTFADLMDERQAVLHTLVELGCFPAGMEFFPASSADALTYIQSIIDDSDYYVLIVGGKYGSLTDQGISFTQAEYEYAAERKPVLAFLHGDPDGLAVRLAELEPDRRARLAEFRKLVEGRHVCKYWTTATELAGRVASTLAAAFEENPQEGWIRNVATDPSDLAGREKYNVVRHVETMKLSERGFTSELTMTLRARVAGLEVFYRQASGAGETRFVDAEALSTSTRILRPMIDIGDDKRYFVHIGRQLVAGEEATVRLLESYEEDVIHSETTHSYFVNHALERLVLSVEYPSKRLPVKPRWRIYRGDVETGDVVDGGPLALSEDANTVFAEFQDPMRGHSYAIEWNEAAPDGAPGARA